MEIPGWFGIGEFYAILVTVWFALIMYLLITVVKVKKGIKVKESFSKFKSWYIERKKRKEEKLLEGS